MVADAVARALEPDGTEHTATAQSPENLESPESPQAPHAPHRFFVSDYTPTFERIAQQFFGNVVTLELAH